eukprot:scaffold14000_cov57-Phaeocystis_antarctica.AAC.2
MESGIELAPDALQVCTRVTPAPLRLYTSAHTRTLHPAPRTPRAAVPRLCRLPHALRARASAARARRAGHHRLQPARLAPRLARPRRVAATWHVAAAARPPLHPHRSWRQEAPALGDSSAPSTRGASLVAQGAPSHPGAPPRSLRSPCVAPCSPP